MNSLADRAILVKVVECMNGVYKYDQQAKADLAQQSGGDAEQFNVTKTMWPKHVIKELRGIIGKGRHIHRKMTLPWSDAGLRLLPNEEFWNFVNAMQEVKNEFIDARRRFKENFMLYKIEGLLKMGKYGGSSVYPDSADDIDTLFQFDVKFRPCPNSGDIRVDVTEEILEDMRREADEEIAKEVRSAVLELWQQFGQTISHMRNVLDSGDPKYFRPSLVTNLEAIIKRIPKYNLVDDPELEQARKEVARAIENIDSVDDLKENEALRQSTVEKLSDLLDKYPSL